MQSHLSNFYSVLETDLGTLLSEQNNHNNEIEAKDSKLESPKISRFKTLNFFEMTSKILNFWHKIFLYT